MKDQIKGLHHVTAISGPPQENVDFFTKVMDQRLVKQTVNFDAPDTYHLYYGTQAADPGSILTFFPFVDAGPGHAGPGMASAYAYGLNPRSFDDWMRHWADRAVDFDGPSERFGSRVIILRDPDGAPVEIAEDEAAPDHPGLFHGVTLWLEDIGPTRDLLADVMGYEEIGHETLGGEERLRLKTAGDAPYVDLMRRAPDHVARQGKGTIHHVAFRASDDADQLEWRERLLAAGMQVTPVIDRQYFNAIYFRSPGGVLFEIATDPPGFAADEAPDALGQHLKLPPQYEGRRADIERILPPLKVPA
ncbi:ring-cleaving dioxygenase [Mangrovicoccus ximenensis]|uniref:ring-cleaving dioxygenase n=1 Tax=Mangrovicoccus ximenensis TaxID=1911570 RepID=UPI000D392359|nr:ring-cleaving dioxygenase [Mangrovicoccus ximenensis]